MNFSVILLKIFQTVAVHSTAVFVMVLLHPTLYICMCPYRKKNYCKEFETKMNTAA